MPRYLIERDIQGAEASNTVKVPVVARIAIPFGVVPGLIAALQEQMRTVQEAQAAPDPAMVTKGPLH